MSRIDELIKKLCPNGVEFVSLRELLDYQQPTKFLVKSTAYDPLFSVPVLTAGQTFVLGYTDETEGVYEASCDYPVVILMTLLLLSNGLILNLKPSHPR